jgi:hypothetical protein
VAVAACLRVEAWVVWISKSKRSELKERKGPAAMLGLSALAYPNRSFKAKDDE